MLDDVVYDVNTQDGVKMSRESIGGLADTRLRRPEDGGSARGSLDRELILTEAVRFIDENGLLQLTMRRLGKQLGVEAMALYRYVPSREDLLDGVVDAVLEEYVDPDDESQATTWQDFLQRVANGVRTVAIAHPHIFPLIVTRPPAAPWLRPPLRSLEWVESFLLALREYGFDDEGVLIVYRAFSTFLLGHLLLEVSARGADLGTVVDEGAQAIEVNLDDYPELTRLAPQLAENPFGDEFEESLENLLDRLSKLVAL